MPIKVFISHSTNETCDKAFLEDLRQRLENETEAGTPVFDVLVDYQIKAGETWRTKLLRGINNCQAGIVLLNEQAITSSDWVHTEATLLRWRQWLDNDVVLILILLGQGARQLFHDSAKWRPLAFEEVQFFRDSNGELEFTGTTMNVLDYDAMVERLRQSKRVENSFDKLRLGLWTHLKRAFKDSCINDSEIKELVKSILTEGPGYINDLIENYSVHFDTFSASIENALELIAPWWVNPVASCVLSIRSDSPETNRVFCLNSSNPIYYRHTSFMYIRHAICLAPQFSQKSIVFISGRSGYQDLQMYIEDIMRQVRKGLTEKIGVRRINAITCNKPTDEANLIIDEEVNRWLQRKEDQRKPVFVVLPPDNAKNTELIKAILSKYPSVNLLLLSESREAALQIKAAKHLRPFLEPDVEQREFDCYHDIKAYFD